MKPQLTVLLGSGGVGKTTLAAALALALTRRGRPAALLSVDPAQRLRSALGLEHLPDSGVALALPGAAPLHAALLEPGASLRRWLKAELPDDAARAKLLESPFFGALADRLAGFGDAIACARMAELAEQHPELERVVLDTAPGIAALELLGRPARLMELFDGRLIRWLVRLSRFGESGRVLSALSELSGAGLLREAGGLVNALEGVIATLVKRLEAARGWLADPRTTVLVVCSASDESAEVALALDAAIRELGLATPRGVLNRALPPALAGWAPGTTDARAAAFARWVHNQVRRQELVRARLAARLGPVIDVPESDALEQGSRLESLAALGAPLCAALTS